MLLSRSSTAEDHEGLSQDEPPPDAAEWDMLDHVTSSIGTSQDTGGYRDEAYGEGRGEK